MIRRRGSREERSRIAFLLGNPVGSVRRGEKEAKKRKTTGGRKDEEMERKREKKMLEEDQLLGREVFLWRGWPRDWEESIDSCEKFSFLLCMHSPTHPSMLLPPVIQMKFRRKGEKTKLVFSPFLLFFLSSCSLEVRKILSTPPSSPSRHLACLSSHFSLVLFFFRITERSLALSSSVDLPARKEEIDSSQLADKKG